MFPLLLAGVGALAATKLVHSLLQDNEDSPPVTRKHYPIEHPNPLAESQEETKRQQTALEHQSQQHAMTETSEVLKRYLDLSFKERSQLIDKSIGQLEQAIASQQPEIVSSMIQLLISIHQHSPMPELQQLLTQHGQASPNHPYLLKGG